MEAKKKSYAIIHKISSDDPTDSDIIQLVGICDNHIEALGMVMDDMFRIHEEEIDTGDFEITKRIEFRYVDDCEDGIEWVWYLKNNDGGNYNPIYTWMLLHKFEY